MPGVYASTGGLLWFDGKFEAECTDNAQNCAEFRVAVSAQRLVKALARQTRSARNLAHAGGAGNER